MKKIPDNVIAEIRDRVDLVELIGAYVNLKRSGRNFQGLCPFHQEKTASFNVSPDRGIYHCFGCGVTGDGIRFLMEHDNLSFPEALRNLAERVGVDLKAYEGRGADRSSEEFDLLYRSHALATRLYRELLRGPEGEAARAEIRRRGLSEEITEEYRLGASADAWDRLLQAARKDGIPEEILEKGGLVIRREGKSGHYDRFRGRLMFPIEAVGPKVIGFGGRVLDDGEPKYLNSPESPLFRKRKTLYGIPQALAGLRETREAILVEGYTDVLALANVGIRGVLAALGTAFGADHATWLSRSCDRVTVLFDGDAAGRKAAFSSAGPLLGAGLEVRMVLLPPGEDPDSLVREHGADALRERIAQGKGAVETLLGHDAWNDAASQDRAVRRVLEALVPLGDPVTRRVYLEDLANRVGLPGELLEKRIAEMQKDARRTADRIEARERSRAHAATGGAPVVRNSEHAPIPEPPSQDPDSDPDAYEDGGVPPAVVVTGPPHEAERTFVALLLHDEVLAEGLLEKCGPGGFLHPLTRRVVEAASSMAGAGVPITARALMDSFTEDVPTREFLGELAVSDAYSIDVEKQAKDCVVAMEKRRMHSEQQEILKEMRKAKAQGDGDRLKELARGLASLTASRSSL